MSSATGIDFQNSKFVADLLLTGGVGATSGALAGHLFQIISPVGGAVFGATIFSASPFVANGLNKFVGDSESEKVVKFIGTHFLNIVAGIAAVNYGLGLSLSIVNAVYLTGTTGLMAFTTGFVLSRIDDLIVSFLWIKKQFFGTNLLLAGGLGAMSGALAGHLFQLISPVGGAVFGAACGLSFTIYVERELDLLFWNLEAEQVQYIRNRIRNRLFVQCIAGLFVGTVAGTALVIDVLGLSLSMVNAVPLTCTIGCMSAITFFVLDIIQDQFK